MRTIAVALAPLLLQPYGEQCCAMRPCHTCLLVLNLSQVNKMELPGLSSLLKDRDAAIKRGAVVAGKRYEVRPANAASAAGLL